MNCNEKTLSEKRKTLNKSLSELIDVLNDIATNGGGSDTFTDSDGNEIRLEIDVAEDQGIINLDLRQQYSNIFITVSEPAERMLKELKDGGLLNVSSKKK